MKQESLLPDTDAIRKGTVEWSLYRGKHLVRYKALDGNVYRKTSENVDEAHVYFWKCANELEGGASKHRGR